MDQPDSFGLVIKARENPEYLLKCVQEEARKIVQRAIKCLASQSFPWHHMFPKHHLEGSQTPRLGMTPGHHQSCDPQKIYIKFLLSLELREITQSLKTWFKSYLNLLYSEPKLPSLLREKQKILRLLGSKFWFQDLKCIQS